MGQKVNPIGFRVTVSKDWRSKWFAARKDFGNFLLEDIKIRSFLKDTLAFAAINKIIIERATNKVKIFLYTARPGLVIGRKGTEIDRLKEDLAKMTGGKEILLEIEEVKTPDKEAQLIAENVGMQIIKRVSYRRAIKKAMVAAMAAGAKGVKIQVSGRLAGVDIARREWFKEGSIPLHTLRADIDYGFYIAKTTYGTIGVKAWVFKGEHLVDAVVKTMP